MGSITGSAEWTIVILVTKAVFARQARISRSNFIAGFHEMG